MKFFSFSIIWLTFNTILIQFTNAQELHDALVIQKTETELSFPIVFTTEIGAFSKYKSWRHNSLTYLCPDDHKIELKVKGGTIYEGFCFPAQICKNAVEPTILRVDEVLKNNHEKEQIHLYHIGFAVNDPRFSDVIQTRKYVGFNLFFKKNYRFMPMISVYHDTELQLTIAVKYKLIQVDMPISLEDNASTYKPSNLVPDKIQEFYEKNHKSKLREIFGEIYDENKHVLNLDSLVNENDFIVEEWKKTARFKIHHILIWKENLKIWKFARELVRQIGTIDYSCTIIAAGIGKPLIIKDGEKEYKMEWGQGKNKIFIPDLYWIAIKFRSYSNKNTIGIFIVVSNELTIEGNNLDKICDTSLCQKISLWKQIEKLHKQKLNSKIYCCPMHGEEIEKLGATFLLNKLNVSNGLENIITSCL